MARRKAKTNLERLRDLPVIAHPLHVFLVERGVRLEDAASALGWSLRKLKNTIAWRHYPADGPERLEEIAHALGFEVEALFPRERSNGRDPHAA